jgi:hypothetical protein
MRNVDLYVARSDEVPMRSFVVARLKRVLPQLESYGPDDIQEIYHGEMTQADALIGYGIIRWLKSRKEKAMIIFNCEETEIPKEFGGK